MSKKPTFIKILIIIFPLGLVGMVIGSLFLFQERRVDQQEENPLTQRITGKGILDHYKKLEDYMTPRGYESEEEIDKLLKTEAWIGGTLSYANTGLNTKSETVHTESGRIWKEYTFSLNGQRKMETVRLNYAELSNVELAAVMAYAEALPRSNREVKIIFSPIGNTEESFISKEALRAAEIGKGNALNYDGVDWDYLAEKLKEQVK